MSPIPACIPFQHFFFYMVFSSYIRDHYISNIQVFNVSFIHSLLFIIIVENPALAHLGFHKNTL